MPQDDLIARLRATFLEELDEQVRELNAALLRLEQQPRDEETVRTLFRSAHTIKGAARVAGVPLVEDACHALESVFAAARDGRRRLDGGDFSLLFGVVDALADARDRLRRDRSLDGSPLGQLLPRLDAAATDAASAGGRAAAAGGGSDGGRTAAKGGIRAHDNAAAKGGISAGAHGGAEGGARGAAPAAPAAAPSAGSASGERQHDAGGDELVRVRADRLDDLLAAVGELLVATGRVVEARGAQDEDARRLDGATAAVADVVHRLRLRAFSDVCEALPRAARDVAAAAGREVVLEVSGQDVEADRHVMDSLREPLLHLVRNAVDHGIEAPAERERAGKPRAGTVSIAAELTAGRLVVTVADDGAGLDEDAVRAALRAAGRPAPATAGELAEAVLAGGFSTRSEATAISGRGVGVDLVRSAVERIGGIVEMHWEPGAGTTFVLACPPTPATIRALLVRVGGYVFALPTAHVVRLLRIHGADVHPVEGRTVLALERGNVPVHDLAALLGPPLEARPVAGGGTAVIVSAGARRAALVVDEALAEAEIVVRPLDVDDDALPHAVGAAVLATGAIALVLGAGALLMAAARAGTAIAPTFAPAREAPAQRILVADDSITTRTLEQSVLESAGYAVATAVNGEDAWQQLEQDGADLVVADVEMPRMDGFALCRRIRASPRHAGLPVVLVTGLDSEEDRARGLEAGADAYITKSSFDQDALLDTIRQLISRE